MATKHCLVLGVLCFKLIPKYCNVWYEGILHISQWSNTGSSWPSCLKFISVVDETQNSLQLLKFHRFSSVLFTEFNNVLSIFSWNVFGENLRYCYSFDAVVRCWPCGVKTVTFCNISVIVEDIYWKLLSMCSLSKEQCILARETVQNAFFFFLVIDFLSSIKHSTAKPWYLHAVLLFEH